MPGACSHVGLLDRPEGPQQTIKVCVLGKGNCGKTQLINRLVNCPGYTPQQTLGLQVKAVRWPSQQKEHLQQDEIPTTFEFWEVGSAAAVKDSSLLPAAKQSSAVAMLVFSMTDRAGFNQLSECQAELEPTPCIAIATKCDLVQSWTVTMAEVEAVAKSNKLPMFPLDIASGSEGSDKIASGSEGSDKTGTVYSAIYQKIFATVEENLW